MQKHAQLAQVNKQMKKITKSISGDQKEDVIVTLRSVDSN